jgi:ABC-type sugar transport system substrate-binding protein
MQGPKSGGTRFRELFAGVAVLAALAALGVLASVSWSATGSSNSFQYQYGSKVTICHHTHSTKNPWVTITVAQAAVKAHLKHGDTLGACSSSKTHGKPSTTTTTTSTTASTSSSTTHSGSGSSNGNGKGKGHSK